MTTFNPVKVFVPGGILAPSSLKEIVETAERLGSDHFQFGRRQEIITRIPDAHIPAFRKALSKYEIEAKGPDGYQKHNIVCSYMSQSIAPSTYWVREDTYRDILDDFIQAPTVRVNITDLAQDLVYSFTGEINFVASDEINLWHVYLMTEDNSELSLFPRLIYTEDVYKFTREFERNYRAGKHKLYEHMEEALLEEMGDRLVVSIAAPRISVSEFFNYEGFHHYEKMNWLGIYTRETKFNTGVLDAFCRLCQQTMLGQIHITPWKSLIVKNILNENLTDWKVILAQNNLSNGHAQSELNWQINNFDDEAQVLKSKLRKYFIKNDINTNGVIIGINNRAEHSFSHMIIKEVSHRVFFGKKIQERYEVRYRKDFNPTLHEFVVYRTDLLESELPDVIQAVIKLYNKKAYIDYAHFDATPRQSAQVEEVTPEVEELHHSCGSCQTTYFEEYGDPGQNVQKGTKFEELPQSYCCSVCGSEKSNFVTISGEDLILLETAS